DAKKVLEEVLGDPHSMGKFLAQKELIHIEEDAERFGNAITGWGKFLGNPQLQQALNDPGKTVAEQRRMKEVYFEGYYHFVYCNFMYGKKHLKADKKEFYIKRAADYIVKLETSGNREGWEIAGPRFVELLNNETMLKEPYEVLKKNKK